MERAYIEATERFDKELLVRWHKKHMKVLEKEYGYKAGGEQLGFTVLQSLVEACGGSVPIQGLQPISFSHLNIGRHHKGRVLFGQLCVHAFKVSSVQTVLAEPAAGPLAARLAIYNAVTFSHKLSSIRRMFPKGAHLAIKEPYFKRALDGGLTLRVDNPANLEFLPAHDIPPARSLDPCTPQQLRRQGNELFRMGDWKEAERLYGSCISLLLSMNTSRAKMAEKLEGVEQNAELLLAFSNRAEARLQLQYHEKALLDAARALELSPKHIKSLYRKGRALLSLHQYKDAAECFQTGLQLSSPANSNELKAALHHSRERNKQSIRGKYDLVSLCKHEQEEKGCAALSSLQCAEFIGDAVRFGMAESGKGRGLFVKRVVKCGELLLASNAVAIGRAREGLFGMHFHLDTSSRACSSTYHEDLIAQVIDRVRNSERTKQQVYSLASGANGDDEYNESTIPEMRLFRPNVTQREMDIWCSADMQLEKNSRCSDVDVDRIRGIVRTNGFQHSTTSDSVGLWVMPSFINHSCTPNAFFLFFGDTMFVRAARDIAEGEEVSLSYTDALEPYTERAEKLGRWGFKCECERCVFEQSVGYCTAHLATRASEEVRRTVLHSRTIKFLNVNDPPVGLISREKIWSICEDLEWACKHILNIGCSQKQLHWLRTSFGVMYLAAYHAATWKPGQMSKDIPHAEEFVRSIQETLGASEHVFITSMISLKEYSSSQLRSVASTRLQERLKEMSVVLYGAQTPSALSLLLRLRENVYIHG